MKQKGLFPFDFKAWINEKLDLEERSTLEQFQMVVPPGSMVGFFGVGGGRF